MMDGRGSMAEAAKKSRAETRRRGEDEGTVHDWPLARLGDVCDVRAGADYKAVLDDNGQYPIYGTGGIIGRASQYRCPANSVIVGRKGTLDNPLLVNEPFWNIDTCFGLIPDERLDAKYLWRFCQNFDFYSLCPSSGRPSTTSDAIRDISIPLPPLSVQREIVTRLDAAMTRAGQLEKDFADLAAQADAEFKAALNEEFAGRTGGTGGTSETGGSRSSSDSSTSSGSSGSSQPWPLVRLGEVCEVIAGQSPEGTNYTEDSSFTEFHQGAKAFGNKVLKPSGVFTKEETKIAPPGAILLSVRAPVGTLNLTDRRICIGRGLAALLPHDGLDRNFLYLYLLSAKASLEAVAGAGSVFASLSCKVLSSLEVPLPPLSIQREIVARLDAAMARCEKVAALARRAAESCATLRKALLKEAFE